MERGTANEAAMAEGVFITFEGGDGSGKSTQIQRVRDWFESQGRQVSVTREPGGTELGKEIRRLVQNGPEDVDPRSEALLYAADRAYHVATRIRPALARGEVVLADRYIDSSVAYQGAARSLGVDEIRSLSVWATQGLNPELTFLLDLPPEVGARRRTNAPDRLERESMEFHERVRHEYLRLADAEPDRIIVIDAVGTPDEVFSEIRGVLEERYPHSAPSALTGETPCMGEAPCMSDETPCPTEVDGAAAPDTAAAHGPAAKLASGSDAEPESSAAPKPGPVAKLESSPTATSDPTPVAKPASSSSTDSAAPSLLSLLGSQETLWACEEEDVLL